MIVLLLIGLAVCLVIFIIGWIASDPAGGAVIAINIAIVGTLIWSLLTINVAGNEPPTCNEPEKKIVAVQPSGHRHSTSYVITANDGTIKEIDNPPVIGQMYCFNPHEGWHWPSWGELQKTASLSEGKKS